MEEVDLGSDEGVGAVPRDLPADVATLIGDGTIWHMNSTATGGGVAELLHRSISIHNHSGLRARWLVLAGGTNFFSVTKRLHHRLHGRPDSAGDLGPTERMIYEMTAQRQAEEVLGRLAPQDLCVLHDPQTLALAPHLAAAGLPVAWRCHIGTRDHTGIVADTWEFLAPYLRASKRCGVSVKEYAPPLLEPQKIIVVPPSIDPIAWKNRPLTESQVRNYLRAIGLESEDRSGLAGDTDHSSARAAEVLQDQGLPPRAPMILQVSRWDPLKDMTGVLHAFTEHVANICTDAHLVLAGPAPEDIPDDPEGEVIHASVVSAWHLSPPAVRKRVHVVTLHLRDRRTNAYIVNALQTRAQVIVQKSLCEGFGLTVTEAMWKGKAIVASGVGGILTQIRDGREGLLIQNPEDLSEVGQALVRLLQDPMLRDQLGRAAHRRCSQLFLAEHEFRRYCSMYSELMSVDS